MEGVTRDRRRKSLLLPSFFLVASWLGGIPFSRSPCDEERGRENPKTKSVKLQSF